MLVQLLPPTKSRRKLSTQTEKAEPLGDAWSK